MIVDPPDDDIETADGRVPEPDRVHLCMADGADRQLLAQRLESAHEISTGGAADGTFDADLWVVDAASFRRSAEEIADRQRRAEPAFLPVLLIVPAGEDLVGDPSVWDAVDDVMEAPIRPVEFDARLSNLLERRHTSTRLAARERALERTVEELELTKRAIDAAPVGITITAPERPDNPTVYANAAFERITGYDREDVLGRNMRFLQGPATDEAAIAELGAAIEAEQSHSTTLVNYHADGTRFWNRVDVAPVYDSDGSLTHYVGFQTDVTRETVREQRLAVLNRVLRHNLSNEINIVHGHAENLLGTVADRDVHDALVEIRDAAAELAKLAEDTRRVERTLGRCHERADVIEVGETLEAIQAELATTHPGGDITLDVECGPWYVRGNGLAASFHELIENGLVHNDGDDPTVEVVVGPADGNGRLEVTIADDGAGMHERLVEVFQSGQETPLNHGDGLGLWLVHWTVTLLGGDVAIETGGESGTAVTLALPAAEQSAATP